MKDKKSLILNQFEPDIAAKLLEFGHRISNTKTDYFLFMSRKFCCLYDVLTSIGVPPAQFPIISDKTLDLDLKYLKDKSIHIVDDIIICGSSIWKTIDNIVQKISVKSVSVSVFCINEKWWVPECINPDYKSVVLSDARAMTFCTGVVNALSVAPRPYAVEYPQFQDIEIKIKDWHRFLSAKDWTPFDITTSLQRDHDISSYTFFPSSSITEYFKDTFGEHVYSLVDILKIRIYAQKLNWGIRMTVLPIVTFKPMDDVTLTSFFNNHLNTISYQIGNPQIIDTISASFVSPTSKLRLLQFNAAMLIGSSFIHMIQESQGKTMKIVLRDFDIEILFGHWNLDVLKLISNYIISDSNVVFSKDMIVNHSVLDLEQTELTELIGEKLVDEIDDDANPRNIISDFNNIFLSLYDKKELVARESIKKASEMKQWDVIRKMDRLETGITWVGILEYLKHTYSYDLTDIVKNTLSLVLDSAVDKGIAVPVIRYNETSRLIYRAYRHGEDVLFAEEEAELSGITIESLIKSSRNDLVPKLVLEKTLVLLIKIGVAKKFLQVQYGISGQDGVVSIRFYLHGAISQYISGGDLYSDTNIWLSDHLIELGIIKKRDKNHYIFNKHIDAIQINPIARLEALKLGGILGTLIKGIELETNKRLKLDETDLILLSTCWRLRDVAAALRIELVLFNRYLFPILSKYILSNDGKDNKEVTTILNAIYGSKGYQALNSLHLKYTGWKNNKHIDAVTKGVEILNKCGQTLASLDWEGYWASQDIVSREDEETIFLSHVERMAIFGHRILFYTFLLEACILIKLFLTQKSSIEIEKSNLSNIDKSIHKLKNFVERTHSCSSSILSGEELKGFERLIVLSDNNYTEYDESKMLSYIWLHISKYQQEMMKVLDLTLTELRLFEQRKDSIEYKYVLYYDIIESTATKRGKEYKEIQDYRQRLVHIKQSINAFVHILDKDASKEEEQVYCWNGDSSSTNDAKYVFFTGRKSGYSLRRLVSFIDKLVSLSSTDINFRILTLPCGVFHSHAFRLFQKVEVDGEQFWEHLSRAQKKYKELESDFSDKKSLILVLDKDLVSEIQKRSSIKFNGLWTGTIVTEISGYMINTDAELFNYQQ